MPRRRTLAVGVAAVVLLAGAATGVALARSPGANAAPRLVEGKSLLVASAAYLGIPLRTLRAELRPGHPLAAIASSTPGRTVPGLEAALYHDAASRISQGRDIVSSARQISGWLHRRIAGYVAGLCPLHMSSLADKRGGPCPGMSMVR